MGGAVPIEVFESLQGIPGLVHGFVLRQPGVACGGEGKEEALRRLRPFHEEARAALGMADWPLVTGEQVHGDGVAVVDAGVIGSAGGGALPGLDGLVTVLAGVALGIHVADCGAVYLVDPVRRAAGLVHAGRKGTERGIVSRAIRLMEGAFGCRPPDLVVQLSPCVRPPVYEVDFAADIVRQCREAGVDPGCIHDAGTCTSSDPDRYYSYRLEKGKTGRHLALLGWGAA